MDIFTNLIGKLLGMGLTDLLAVFVFLFILKLEIKIVLKIVGALIVLQVAYIVYNGVTSGDWGTARELAENYLCILLP